MARWSGRLRDWVALTNLKGGSASVRLVRDVRVAVRNRLVLANLVGGATVLVLTQMAFGQEVAPALRDELGPVLSLLVAVAAFGVTFVVLAVLANLWAYLAFSRSVAWLLEDHAPSEAERAEVLRLPWRSALRPLYFWMFGAVLYAVMASTLGEAEGHAVLQVVDAVVLGGLVTCALGFLLIERSFTPLFAVALAGEPPRRPATLGLRMRLLLAWAAGSSVPLLTFALDALTTSDMPDRAVVVLALVGLGAGALATIVAAHSVATPLDAVRDAMGRVRQGRLDVELTVDDGGEIGELQAGFNNMVAGMREREQLRDLFGRHVGQAVAVRALEQGTGLGGEQRDASVVFVDLIGSTAMAEVLPPDEVVAILNDFFDLVVRIVDTQGGWVNKFEGDGALCVFGVPGTQPDHAARALRAARLLHLALIHLAERHPGLRAGIGVSSGSVVAGNVGTEARYEYTVIGPAVNEAARLTEVAKGRPVKVLASSEAARRAGDEARLWRDVGTIGLRGRTSPTAISEPVPDALVARP
jgi:adenylate cyclase